MRPDDLPAAERVSDETFVDAGRRTRRVSDPEPQPRTAQASKEWTDRIGFLLSVDPAGCQVAVDDPQIAQRLLWEALASAQGPTIVNRITTANHWAVDVGLAARLDIGQEGHLAVRAMQPPAPYLASGHFL